MAHSKQAKKRIRQNLQHNLRNKHTGGSMRTYTKKLLEAVTAGDKKEAQRLLPIAAKHIDKAAKNHVIHANTAARKKGQIMRAVLGMK
jgi:small subunit ribosomal protein S20